MRGSRTALLVKFCAVFGLMLPVASQTPELWEKLSAGNDFLVSDVEHFEIMRTFLGS